MTISPVFFESTMSKAFDLVDPGKRAAFLADVGLITREAAELKSWRDEIYDAVTEAELEEAGVTIDDVARAIEFYTATVPTIVKHTIGSRPWVVYFENQPGYLIRAKGYRQGPAGP